MFCEEERFQRAILNPENTIKDGMKSLNESSLGIILIVSDDKFIGTITDGDIRRALVSGSLLENSLDKIVNKNAKYIVISKFDTEKEILKKARVLMNKYGIREVPLLDENHRPVDLITWKDISFKKEEFYPPISNSVFILAGGLGTRLDPFTKILPKPMIPIGDTPILEMIINKVYEYGFRRFILSVNYKKEIIKNYFNSEEFKNNRGVQLSFVEEQKRLGTAGSLSLIKGKVQDTLLVLNGDIILDTDYRKALDYHKNNKNYITIFAVPQSIKIPYGVLELNNGELRDIKEKPEMNVLINAGVYYIEPDILELIPENEYIDMPDVFILAREKGLKVSAYPVYGNYFDIGQWEEYRKTLRYFENLI